MKNMRGKAFGLTAWGKEACRRRNFRENTGNGFDMIY